MEMRRWLTSFLRSSENHSSIKSNRHYSPSPTELRDDLPDEPGHQYYWNKSQFASHIQVHSAPEVENTSSDTSANEHLTKLNMNKHVRAKSAVPTNKTNEKISRPSSSLAKFSHRSESQLRPQMKASSDIDQQLSSTPSPDYLRCDSNPGSFKRVIFKLQTKGLSTSPRENISAISRDIPEGDVTRALNNPSSSFKVSKVLPIYEKARVAPTRASTPIQDMDQEKRVRFLEAEVVGDGLSRPESAASTYSDVVKNSTRFSFTSAKDSDIYSLVGHSSRICSCPCHFFPKQRHSIGVQVFRSELDPRPCTFRLFVVPSLKGLYDLSSGFKMTAFLVRGLLSQIGLCLVVLCWWLIGSLVFSTLEKPLQQNHVESLAVTRSSLAIDLATELRQVRPFEVLWRMKIDEYMLRLENTVLQAVKAGYKSNKVAWTIPDSFLYSASLTLLLGPGRMIVQSNFTKIFSVIYAAVGIPIVFLLLTNVAYTVIEGVTWLWTWKKRRKVSPSEAQDTNLRRPMNVTIGRRSTSFIESPTCPKQNIKISRVPNLDSPTSFNSDTCMNQTVPAPDTITQSSNAVTSRPLDHCSQHVSHKKDNTPWPVLASFPFIYLILTSSLLSFIHNVDVSSSVFMVCSILLSTDHGQADVEKPQLVISRGFITMLYPIMILFGTLSSLILILGTWVKLKHALVRTGTNLAVLKPIILTR